MAYLDKRGIVVLLQLQKSIFSVKINVVNFNNFENGYNE